jgi:hypothetical protein
MPPRAEPRGRPADQRPVVTPAGLDDLLSCATAAAEDPAVRDWLEALRGGERSEGRADTTARHARTVKET